MPLVTMWSPLLYDGVEALLATYKGNRVLPSLHIFPRIQSSSSRQSQSRDFQRQQFP